MNIAILSSGHLAQFTTRQNSLVLVSIFLKSTISIYVNISRYLPGKFCKLPSDSATATEFHIRSDAISSGTMCFISACIWSMDISANCLFLIAARMLSIF